MSARTCFAEGILDTCKGCSMFACLQVFWSTLGASCVLELVLFLPHTCSTTLKNKMLSTWKVSATYSQCSCMLVLDEWTWQCPATWATLYWVWSMYSYTASIFGLANVPLLWWMVSFWDSLIGLSPWQTLLSQVPHGGREVRPLVSLASASSFVKFLSTHFKP